MGKVALLGDVHFGARVDSPAYAEYLGRFFTEVFFPYIDEHQITHVIQVGDLFDRKSTVNLNTFAHAKRVFFDSLEQRGISLYVGVGNHDMAQKDSLTNNAPALLLKGYFEFEVIDRPRTIEIDGLEIDVVPWICKDNEVESLKFMQESQSPVCVGHFQLLGFEMDPGAICTSGFDRKILSKYKKVFSGHFHHRSNSENIYYIGNPTQITWIDDGDPRGFSVLDTDTLELEFIQSPLTLFRKFLYDDVNDLDAMKTVDPTQFTGRYVKVLVINKTNASLYDKVIKKIEDANPADLKVFEELVLEKTEGTDAEALVAEDTLTFINACVDAVQVEADPTSVKTVLRDLYFKVQV